MTARCSKRPAAPIKADLEEGTQAAATRGKLPPLEADELDHLLDIFASSARFTGVDIGDEVVLSKDGSGTPQLGSRVDALYACEQVLAHDTVRALPHRLLLQGREDHRALRAAVHEGGPGAPDFLCRGPGNEFTVEATTVAPSKDGPLAEHPARETPEECANSGSLHANEIWVKPNQ